ncbi:hypothetical protein QFC22_002309 [Naganishia vaughanmartiniae]|uniref:Uncharacterized protein n=1 Tax=Naganishia vaughanmartiniae TaxID=1424756 RepID=A0ACC2XCB4_9TREE|nr:hypothetical protein QFC22_002309 [Naganishia vaughanmartiniae]
MFALPHQALPALTKAFEVLEKMINHLHFLPLSTTLLAITSRLFVITIDISAYVMQYQSAAQDLSSTGQSGVNSPRSNFKEKNRDTALLQLEDVVGMMVSGRMPSGRISVAQEQLEAKLSALQETTDTRTTQSIVEPLTSKATMMEMEGEDFGEAVAPPRRATSPRIARSAVIPPTPVVPVVLDPPSSPEEIIVAPLPIRKRIPGSTETRRIPAELGQRTVPPLQISPNNVIDLTRSAVEQVPSSPPHTIKKTKGKKRPADGETTFTTQPTERASPATVMKDASRSDSKVNKKKKKGKDLMDDIFGL